MLTAFYVPQNIFLGRRALLSPMKSKKHGQRQSCVLLKDFLESTTDSSVAVTSSNFVTSELIQVNPSSIFIVGFSTNSNTDQALSNPLVQNKIDTFFIKNNITTVEVLWCIELS